MTEKGQEAEKSAEISKHNTSILTLPDHFKDLLTLDLSGVGQGDDALGVDGQCVNADTRQNKPCVSGNNKAGIGGHLEAVRKGVFLLNTHSIDAIF